MAKNIIYDLTKLPDKVRDEIENTDRYRKLFSERPKHLGGIAKDYKTQKSIKLGVGTYIKYFIPSDISGVQMCPLSNIALCSEPCLNTAGRGGMNIVQMSRVRKTLYYLQFRDDYKEDMIREIKRLLRYCKQKNLEPMIRPNGTSDIRWENTFPEMFHLFPDVMFYDYTKIPNRTLGNIGNYDLTFSYSGVEQYQPFVRRALQNNHLKRMAVVFREHLPDTFTIYDKEFKVVSGDESDVRPYDEENVVVGLIAKGRARHDTSGFVVN
jgi:hypothetical protein